MIFVIAHGQSAYLWTEVSPLTKDHLDRQLLSVNDQHLFLMSDLLNNVYSCVILYKTTCQVNLHTQVKNCICI